MLNGEASGQPTLTRTNLHDGADPAHRVRANRRHRRARLSWLVPMTPSRTVDGHHALSRRHQACDKATHAVGRCHSQRRRDRPIVSSRTELATDHRRQVFEAALARRIAGSGW